MGFLDRPPGLPASGSRSPVLKQVASVDRATGIFNTAMIVLSLQAIVMRAYCSVYLPVIIHDSVNSVSYCDDSAVIELIADGVLDEIICEEVHRTSSFIQNQDLCLPEQCSGKAH